MYTIHIQTHVRIYNVRACKCAAIATVEQYNSGW